MDEKLTDINAEFGVDEGALSECASTPALVMPQFVNEGGFEESVELTPQVGLEDDPSGCDVVAPSQFLPSQERTTQPKTINPWPPQLVMDLALRVDDQEDILLRHNITQQDLDHLFNNLTFRRELAAMTKELAEDGQSFRIKSRMMAEQHLVTVDDIANDLDATASTRLAAVQSMVKWGDLEPKDKKQEQATGPQIAVQINF